MYSKILDLETFSKVVGAAPRLEEYPREIARRLVSEIIPEWMNEGDDPQQFQLSLLAGDFADSEVTPREVGMVCREMGLQVMRMRDGYHVWLNWAQLKILQEYFQTNGG